MAMEKERLVALVTKAQNGDNAATNELFNEFYNDLYYFALKTIKDDDLALDVTQEAFVEIINTLGNLKEPAAFVTWAKQITYHQCTRYFKKKKDVLVDEDEDGKTVFDDLKEESAEFIPDEALDKADFKNTVMSIVEELPEEQRSATMMYYFDEMSIREIAQVQGVSENTIKSRLNYGRKTIKNGVEEYQEKNGVKLYSVAVAPMFKWAYEDFFSGAMEPTYAERMAREISNATGNSLSIVSDESNAELGTAVKNNKGNVVKPLARKIVSVAVAGAIFAAGAITTVVLSKDDNDNTPNPSVAPPQNESLSTDGDDIISNGNSTNGLDYDAIIDGFVESGLNTFELYVGDTHSPGASVWLKNGRGSVYTSDENVVNVTKLGKVTALREGSAYVVIGAMYNSMYEVYRYDVFNIAPEADLSNVPQIEGIDFLKEIENFNSTNLNTIELKVGQTHSPTASVWAKSGGECFTSDTAVATVAADGTVTAQGRGTAYIIIKAGIGTMFEMYKYVVK